LRVGSNLSLKIRLKNLQRRYWMQPDVNFLIKWAIAPAKVGQQATVARRLIITTVVSVVLLFLALYNLTGYPLTWFDEGSHLHVPKTLVRFGVYADYSSEGFRYYGPTVGVGPTVMLPITLVFQLFGFGLLQARLVMVLYLLATIYVFYCLANRLGNQQFAWVATALLVASRGVSLLEYGRQVLGEVPGLFFVLAGFLVWFANWEKASWRRLGLVGLLLGLAMITKNQYLLVLAPTLGLAWLANLVYYRTAPQRTFIIPGLVAGACFALWQIYMILYLGPATASENLAALRTATAGAALVFSPNLMKRGLQELLSLKVYLGWLLPVLLYGFLLALPRRREGQQWGVLLGLILVNLLWYVVASISWLRYAFPALALASLFVARFFYELTDGFKLNLQSLWQAWREGQAAWIKQAGSLALLIWLAVMIVVPLGQTVKQIVLPEFNAPIAMAAYLDEQVSQQALIETWEPELGFLTNHNYHFPPPLLLNQAVGHVWLGKPSPAQEYTFVQDKSPDYVLVGGFARWVGLYPQDWLATHYRLETNIGNYELYALNK
jgi:4-amino-4-deoxy-L-arabinose transferase-like glycosyltransferase